MIRSLLCPSIQTNACRKFVFHYRTIESDPVSEYPISLLEQNKIMMYDTPLLACTEEALVIPFYSGVEGVIISEYLKNRHSN